MIDETISVYSRKMPVKKKAPSFRSRPERAPKQIEDPCDDERFRLLVESVQEYAIFMLDPEGHIITWNAGAERLKGYKAAEITGKHFSIFYPEEDQKKPDFELREAVQKGRYQEEGWRIRKDGTKFWALVVITALKDKSGKLLGFSKVTRDMTDRKKTEEILRNANTVLEKRVKERTQELQTYAGELMRSNADLQQFAYIASHDLQEPLRVVSTSVDFLAEKLKDHINDDTRELLRFAQEGAVRAQRLISELLHYSRIGEQGQNFTGISFEEVLRHVLSLLELSIRETNASVTHDPLPVLAANQFQVEQLLQNLISNALKYHGGKPPRIHISAKKQNDVWIFSVKDSGIGIDPKQHNSIFVIFKRLHSIREYPGTGIGLALCKKIVERHGGRIWVESTPGSGSTFYFTLPAER